MGHGMRVREVSNLTLEDIDLRGGQIIVDRVKGSLKTTQQLMPHRGEPLLDEFKALKAYLAVRPADSGNALFVSQKGGHLSTTQLYRIYRDLALAAGLPASKAHPHCLKHSCATTLIAQGMNLARVKQYLGHAAISSTMRYISVSDQDASRDAVNAFQNAF
jgi:site-specific recombinase XerD